MSQVRINDVLEALRAYRPQADLNLVRRAYVFSAQVHRGHLRLSGEPYLTHPLNVAHILTRLRTDEYAVATGLLHDTLEDTCTTPEQLEELFGPRIAFLVDGVTKIGRVTFRSQEERQAESFRKMILAMTKDLRVLLVKLADRLHNMRTLQFLPPERQRTIAQETLEIYAPLANRLGIGWMRVELEDLCFRYLHPQAYRELEQRLAEGAQERQRYVEEVLEVLRQRLEAAGLRARLSGRPKHLYGIWRKMTENHLELDQVYDLVGFRIIVDTVKQCYEALGVIHSCWTPVPGRFKDFIAMPKQNMYQSLHTTVIGPGGRPIEIQIRTEAMHRIAEEGISAHWKYKEGGEVDEREDRYFSWLRRMLDWQQELRDPRDFLDALRLDLFPDEVYVFTPKGEVRSFPRGATPVDFAYSIHTEVGHRCAGARVNGRLVPLDYQLQSGDQVEIITSSRHKPSPDWLTFVKTSRARAKIREFLRVEERQRLRELGRASCERAFRRAGRNFSAEAEQLAQRLGYRSVDDLLVAVGSGKVAARALAAPRARRGSRSRPSAPPSGEGPVWIPEVGAVEVRLARCCNPLPGDPIVGHVTRGHGITVHLAACPRVVGVSPERRVEVRWSPQRVGTRPAKIRVVCQDQRGLLAQMSSSISAAEANISQAHVHTTPDGRAISLFEVEVRDLDHLKQVMRSLEHVPGVFQVERLTR